MDGVASQSRFAYPSSLCLDPWNNIFVSDTNANSIRKIHNTTGDVSTFARGFSSPYGVECLLDGTLIVADTAYNQIKRVDSSGGVAVFGTGFNQPMSFVQSNISGNAYVFL